MKRKFNLHDPQSSSLSRRSFLQNSSVAFLGAAAVSGLPFVVTSHSAPDEPIRIGLIGCGGRGTGAVLDALGAATKVIYPSEGYHTENVADGDKVERSNIKVGALADVFEDRLDKSRSELAKLGIDIARNRCFTGFDAYEKLL